MLRFLTAGESHGQALVAILEGVPAGLHLDPDEITRQLKRRQGGHGRGRRMTIEADEMEILSGLRLGETIGSPIAFLIRNRDWANWQRTMWTTSKVPHDATGSRRPPVTRPRPGHVDLAGGLKYDRHDLRDVLERASARETAARVGAGAIARQLLGRVGIRVASHVLAIGGAHGPAPCSVDFARIEALPPDAPVPCIDPAAGADMIAAIDAARGRGDTVGGTFEVVAAGVPVGLGSHVQWDRKLDGRLSQAVMSIPAIKAVGIGIGVDVATRPGSEVHDEIVASPGSSLSIARPTNRAGGIEGGISNGEEIRLTAYMKPISTLMRPLRSVDLATGQETEASIERSDTCAVPAAAIVAEAMVALVLADALLETFGGDTVDDLVRRVAAVRGRVAARLAQPAAPSAP